MEVIYKLNEHDLKKLLADHFEGLEDDVQLNYATTPDGNEVLLDVVIYTEID